MSADYYVDSPDDFTIQRPNDETMRIHADHDCVPLDAALASLEQVRDRCITGPEKRAVDDCIKAVRDLLGGEA